jgi:hypothetical protein
VAKTPALRKRPSWPAAIAIAVCTLTLGRSAAAYHTDSEHITDDTAWTLTGDKAFRVGLYKASATIADRLDIGTYVWPWVLRTPNAFAKLRFLDLGPWQWAVEVGFFRLDTRAFQRADRTAPVITVGAIALVTSIEIARSHQLSNKLVGTAGRVTGVVDQDSLVGEGRAGITNMQYVLAYEYRASRSLALVLTGRYQLFQVVDGDASFTTNPDEYTSIEVQAAARDPSTLNFRNAFSIVPAIAWSWSTFNLRIGAGFGNFNVPGVNVMLASRTPIPELDLFWTF